MGGLFGGGKAKKAAKIQADATLKAAEDEAAANRVAAQAAQANKETLIAQTAAAEAAREKLARPMEQVDVTLATPDDAEIDPVTKRRRPTRASFMSAPSSSSGLNI